MDQLRIRKPKARPRRAADAPHDLSPELRRAFTHRRALRRELDDLMHDIERALHENAGKEVD
jgi:hypothetical protein